MLSVNEKTVARWKADPGVRGALVQKRQSEIIDRALGRLAGAAVRAVKALVEALKSQEGDSGANPGCFKEFLTN